ncbi:hypothetical protein KAS79_03960 [Candidatus Parcubacteria bacterium]|nr:hypothetical protein [Candidatus Parcubacteria bacterium]
MRDRGGSFRRKNNGKVGSKESRRCTRKEEKNKKLRKNKQPAKQVRSLPVGARIKATLMTKKRETIKVNGIVGETGHLVCDNRPPGESSFAPETRVSHYSTRAISL